MTKSKIKRNYFFQNLFIIILLCIIFLIVALPKIAIESFWTGILIWAKNVLPALLPFFILTKLLSFTPLLPAIGKKLSPFTQKFYNVGGVAGYIFIMSIISGYPIGAKLTADLYTDGKISAREASTISSFTSTSGPLFIIGTVAIGFFHSTKLGIIIIISHFIGAILNGFIYRRKQNIIALRQLKPIISHNIIGESMKTSIESVLLVGGFIALFYMILQALIYINAFTFLTYPLELIGIDSTITIAIISGIIEVTSGAMMLGQTTLHFKVVACILSFLISFGGLSIHAQAYAFLKSFDMPYSRFLLQKTTHAILSTMITLMIIIFI